MGEGLMGLFGDVAIFSCKQPEKYCLFERILAIINPGKIKGLDKNSELH